MNDNEHSAENQSQILEIYKLHVKMADRVSQRREGANRLFVTLLSALIALVAATIRFGPGRMPVELPVIVLTVTGLLLTVAWFIIIRAYRQLNTCKFQALHELEQELPFQFYKVEWDKAGQGEDWRKYLKLTVAETFIPAIFAFMFFVIAIWTICDDKV